jgi:hypothetical protein
MSIENYQERVAVEKELNLDEKKNLKHLWNFVVLGNNEREQDTVELMDKKEIKQWMYHSLLEETYALFPELDFEIDFESIEKILAQKDKEKRAKLQLEYIYACNEQFKTLAKSEEQKSKDTRWNTMPLTMREEKAFNCVGASLIGHGFLRKGEIENFYGNPDGHVVNIARLDDGQWWYIDFRNNYIEKVEADVVEIAKVKTLKLNDPAISYSYAPMLEGIEGPIFILGNLSGIKYEATSEDIPDNFPGVQNARKLYARFKRELDSDEIDKFIEAVYPETSEYKNSEIMKKEREVIVRVDAFMRDFFNSLRSANGFDRETSSVVKQEICEKKIFAKKFFESGILSDDMSANMKKVLMNCKTMFDELKQNDPQHYEEYASRIVAIMLK